MKAAKLVLLVVLMAAVGGVLYFKFGRVTSTAEQVRTEIVGFLPRLKDYDKHRAELEGWAKDAHKQATDASQGEESGFDEDLYVATFFEVLYKGAATAGHKELETNLHKLSLEYDNEMAAKAN